MKIISFVAGSAAAIAQYFDPIGGTWIGHVKWASDNLTLGAYIGAPIGVALFLAATRLPKWVKASILIFVGLGFCIGLGISIYVSLTISSVATYADQIFYRDTVWKLAHLSCSICLTVFLFCLSFFATKPREARSATSQSKN